MLVPGVGRAADGHSHHCDEETDHDAQQHEASLWKQWPLNGVPKRNVITRESG
jgi:hypothetical protein